ncbi:MAG: YceH family protein [Desulfobacteraceae bacterium]|nr:YceH family protein [Desulfobacteraceae bacterium]
MEIELNAVELRILGVLIEKQMATPDYYPLTLNALTNACNQKNNREPLMRLEQAEVDQSLKSLRNQHLAWQIMTHGSRTAKYEHNMVEKIRCSERELSVLCELFLRGPQTPGELNTRTARLIEPHGLIAIEQTLKKLMEHENGPFVVMLPRLPGHKENRYIHLFCTPEQSEEIYQPTVKAPVSRGVRVSNERVEALEKKVNDLEETLDDLKNQFLSFKQQFE